MQPDHNLLVIIKIDFSLSLNYVEKKVAEIESQDFQFIPRITSFSSIVC